MWLSKRVMRGEEPQDAAALGKVTIGGEEPAVLTDTEKRRAKIISPGGYCWNPSASECVMVMKGNELYVSGMPQTRTQEIEPGEVLLHANGASLKLGNDGKITLDADVYIEGDLYVNGQKMEVP